MMSKLGINQLIKIQSTSWWCLFFANSNSAPKTRVLSTILALLVFVHQESINCAVTLFFCDATATEDGIRKTVWLIAQQRREAFLATLPRDPARFLDYSSLLCLLQHQHCFFSPLHFLLLLYNLHFLQNCKVCNHKKGGTPALICWFSRTREHHCVNSFFISFTKEKSSGIHFSVQ